MDTTIWSMPSPILIVGADLDDEVLGCGGRLVPYSGKKSVFSFNFSVKQFLVLNRGIFLGRTRQFSV